MLNSVLDYYLKTVTPVTPAKIEVLPLQAAPILAVTPVTPATLEIIQTQNQPLQKTPDSALITCKACSHFQSFHQHGGGAGACSVGEMPFGACWWADTLHECSQWSANHD